MLRKFIYFLFVLLLVQSTDFASTKGRIKGKVVDQQTGEPLIGANIIVTGSSFGAATDLNGEFILLNLDAGTYELKASFIGYRSVTIQDVRVNSDLTTYLTFELPSEDITTETITVMAEKALIKRDATSSVRIADRESFENLPVRGVNNVIALQAGVVSDNGIRIRGSRTDEIGYYLDGVNITDPVANSATENAAGDGRLVSIGNDAVEEVQVETGGFSAEYGGANAGIIRTQLRTGGTELHASFEYFTDNIAFQSKDDFFDQEKRLGTYWYGQNTSSFVLSGPLFSNKVKFFYNLEYNFNRTSTRKGYDPVNLGLIQMPDDVDEADNVIPGDAVDFNYPGGVFFNDQDESYSHAATVLLDLNPISLRLGGTFATSEFQVGANGLQTMLRKRNGIDDVTDGTVNLRMTHVLSPKMFYEITAGYAFYDWERTDQYLGDDFWAYGDSVANANAGAFWVRTEKDMLISSRNGRYIQPAALDIYGFAFSRENSIPVNYLKRNRASINFKGDFSLMIGRHHSVKIGGEFQQYTIRNWDSRSQFNYAGQLSRGELTQEQILYNAGVNNYGYDVLGNEVDDDFFYGPKKPVFAGVYLQDKIEYSDIILNLGVRFDYFDTDNLTFVDPARPELAFTSVATSGELLEDGWKKVEAFSGVSPRLSVSFPVTDRTVFHAGFGKYVQQPSLGDLYTGVHNWAYQIGGGFFFSAPVAVNLQPTRKTHYEIGFRNQFTDFLAVDLTAYYDDIKDQVQFRLQRTDAASPYKAYTTLSNSDFATTKGLELTLTMRRYERVAINASFTFSDAKGTGSYPNSNSGIIGAPLDGVTIFTPQYISPLEFNRPYQGNVNIDYRFGPNDGPAFLHNFGVNLLARFNSGHPFTRGVGGRNLETDGRDRRPVEPLGASMTPSGFQVDLKVDKTFNIWDKLNANIYIRVLNLFDARDVLDVYKRSGDAGDDAYISDPSLGGVLVDTYGSEYEELYKTLTFSRNGFYSNARQILFGVRLEY
ncbi:MAG: TonB-dependent receptor [Melioribacteraceae bacterium]|nr:TonB-dependent receptor [Melioribacteraceae bacterium]